MPLKPKNPMKTCPNCDNPMNDYRVISPTHHIHECSVCVFFIELWD